MPCDFTKRAPLWIAATILAMGISDVASTQAFARGGGSSFMNSPGYQRRLQESRGQVTNQSGSLLSAPYTTPPSTYPGKKWRKRGRR